MDAYTHTHTSLYACQAATSQASQPGSFTSARRVAQAQVKDPGLRGWPSHSQDAQQGEGCSIALATTFQSLLDLTDYSLLTNDIVSMLTYFSMSGADKDYIPMFSWTNLFLAVLRLNNKVIFNPTKHKTGVSI